jgi:hypothetical protein
VFQSQTNRVSPGEREPSARRAELLEKAYRYVLEHGLVWGRLAAPGHRPLLTLWLEAYARALVEPDGPWAGFAGQTVRGWLGVLAVAVAGPDGDAVGRTLLLAVLRGALLDLLATGEVDRTTAAVHRHLRTLPAT